MRDASEEAKRQPVVDAVPDHDAGGRFLERVFVMPKGIGTAGLLVHKPVRGLIFPDDGFPLHRDSHPPDDVVDFRPRTHPDAFRIYDPEIQPGRRDSAEVPGVFEERKYLCHGQRHGHRTFQAIIHSLFMMRHRWIRIDFLPPVIVVVMRINHVRQALKAGKVQLGLNFGQLRSAEVPRLLAAAGFHWAFIDCEHGNFDLETVNDVCRVAQLVGLCPVLRVADLQYSLVARALDCGAQGIIFPRIEDPKLLETALSWTKFPPVGVRGYGLMAPHTDYEALSFDQVIAHVNENTLTVLQIETKRAVEAREEILSVPGIDAVMIGPADLSISMGVPGEFQHPKMIEAMDSVRETCERYGIAPGTQTRAVPQARFWKDRGMRFLGCGSEIGFMFEKAKETAQALLGD